MPHLLAALLFALSCCTAVAAPAHAAAVPAHVEVELAQARLAGQGTFTFFGLEIYSAQLWVGPEGLHGELPGGQMFALELQYARSLSGARIAQASIDQMVRIGAGTATQHKAWLQQMQALFPDVKPGTRLCGAYLPLRGARFYLNGNLHGAIMDADFARAFFSIWLHPNSTAKSLRSKLLSEADTP